ncbi:hypothetical protein LTR70_010519 [Exophiala xenobiotica]|uniref:Uncharacterized protein n=1 Tax=Lithohypha guttulata TaxID=1690604 RepID=A0ABR0JVH3_9EURO|nr:hypothetical protein LTR24_010440 [Lithohypha guttulata]KAK5309193.1 hypothetical protein LTR70_010519 [Exophiala xenobiotica]
MSLHNVVLAYMPGMRKGKAAGVAASLRVSFPNTRLGLVVGGVSQPTEEIILGDAIVSIGVMQFGYDNCDKHRLVIHFGLMASGDVVIKPAWHQDRIAAEEQVIGFEMENAGVWDNLLPS